MTSNTGSSNRRWARAGSWLAIAAGVFLAGYAATVTMTSLAFRYGWQPPIELTSVEEFMLLGTISVLVITAALCREKAREQNTTS